MQAVVTTQIMDLVYECTKSPAGQSMGRSELSNENLAYIFSIEILP
jgi:hypothetical protein